MKRPVSLEMIWDNNVSVSAVEVFIFYSLNDTCTYVPPLTVMHDCMHWHCAIVKRPFLELAHSRRRVQKHYNSVPLTAI